MRQIVLMLGPPGVGKGTVSQLLVERFGFRWLSSGEILRDERLTKSEAGKAIAELIDHGKFVSDELIVSLMMQEFRQLPTKCCLLLDGFPRTVAQAEALEEIAVEEQLQLELAIELRAETAELERRILRRSTLENREDDNLNIFRHRMSVYQARTAPLIDYYRNQAKLASIDGMGTPQAVCDRASLCIQQKLPKSVVYSQKEAG